MNKFLDLIGFSDNSSGLTMRTLILLGILIIIIGIVVIILSLVTRNAKKVSYNLKTRRADKKNAIMDKMQNKVAKLNTGYIMKDLRDLVQSFIYGIYAGDKNYIKFDRVDSSIGSIVWDTITNEASTGIKREVYEFEVIKFYIAKQQNDYVYQVDFVVCRAVFRIKYAIINNVSKIIEDKTFTQDFSVSVNNWSIKEITKEDIIESEVSTIPCDTMSEENDTTADNSDTDIQPDLQEEKNDSTDISNKEQDDDK